MVVALVIVVMDYGGGSGGGGVFHSYHQISLRIAVLCTKCGLSTLEFKNVIICLIKQKNKTQYEYESCPSSILH